jgi:catechol 2,3-dioxygenase
MTSTLQLTSIHLRVADLAHSVDFYTHTLGFVVATRDAAHAELTTVVGAPPLLTLSEDRTASAPSRDAAGLFHAALLFPSRAALGGWLKHAVSRGLELDGLSDHGVSEAIYFPDPDGNGLEFYSDRPRSAWPVDANGDLAMVTKPLALQSLLAEAGPTGAMPLAGARWGHLHLRVTELDRSEKFYRDTLGMALTQGSYPGARFLAADGYHHHLGLNTWGRPRSPQPAGALGLAEATFAHAGLAAAKTVRDPDGIALHLITA